MGDKSNLGSQFQRALCGEKVGEAMPQKLLKAHQTNKQKEKLKIRSRAITIKGTPLALSSAQPYLQKVPQSLRIAPPVTAQAF